MAATGESIEFNFEHDNSDYYLVGDQMAHGGMFSNYTMSAISRGPAGEVRHILDLPASLSSLPEAAPLIAHGWQQAVFIGKLMTTSGKSEQAEIEASQKSNKKSWSPRDDKLAPRHVGFSTNLFVVQSALEYRGGLAAGADLDPEGIPQLVASFSNGDRRSLRVIPADREAYHYDDQYGSKLSDLSAIGEGNWAAIETFHRKLYDGLSDEIAIRQPGVYPAVKSDGEVATG